MCIKSSKNNSNVDRGFQPPAPAKFQEPLKLFQFAPFDIGEFLENLKSG
jgi:hypothetical protein